MSLVGNLEDLSLGDITQIISLSQKSGVLVVEGYAGVGRIVFQSGLVHAASVKDRIVDLRGLLIEGGHVDAGLFDVCAERAREGGLSLKQVLAQESALGDEGIEALVREAVESAILEMFQWTSGEFSFDVRSELDSIDPDLVLSTGISAQYLAMEGMRLRDERSRGAAGSAADPGSAADSADPPLDVDGMFGDEPLETGPLDIEEGDDPLEIDGVFTAADALVETVVERADHASEAAPSAPSTTAGNEAGSESDASTAPGRASPALPAQSPRSGVLPFSGSTRSTAVVLIEPDVSALEWIKAAIANAFGRVHVFQQAEQGLARIRQYLIRGERPIVLISTKVPIDPLSGIHGLADFVSRLKAQSKQLIVLALIEAATEAEAGAEVRPPAVPSAFDGSLSRPASSRLGKCDEPERAAAARALNEQLHALLGVPVEPRDPVSSEARDGSDPAISLEDLKTVTRTLQEASSRGEVLPVVLEFASGLFRRVAILVVRDEKVFAIAGRGFPLLEVDPLGNSASIAVDAAAPGWIRQALDTGEPLRGGPATPADRELLARMGGPEPAEAYLGLIESGGAIVALLYGDQGPDGDAFPDTSGLEVVLHHAGLALDRAALERALWEVDEQGS